MCKGKIATNYCMLYLNRFICIERIDMRSTAIYYDHRFYFLVRINALNSGNNEWFQFVCGRQVKFVVIN